MHALQVAYRLPAVWMFAALGPEFETHAHGLHVRDFACYDGLHPNHDGRSEAMVSDLLWHTIGRGLSAARQLPPTATYIPPSPLQELPRRVGHVCFTFDAEGWQMLTGAKRTNRKLHEQSLIQTLQVPTIRENFGWAFLLYEPLSRTPFKPGIVANTPGSVLVVEVDTSAARRPSVALQYLEGKSGMGVARLECRHCVCQSTTIDARTERASLLATREVRVSSHRTCQLSITVLNQTGGGSAGDGNKFKLARLFVTGEDDTPAAAPAAEATQAAAPTADDKSLRGCGGTLGPYCALRRKHKSEMLRTPAEDVAWRSGSGDAVNGTLGASTHPHVAQRNAALALLRAARAARKNEAGMLSLRLLLPPTE